MIAYFNLSSGISGDMILSAFIDLGMPLKTLSQLIQNNLNINFAITIKEISQNGIRAKQCKITTPKNPSPLNYTDIKKIISNSSFKKEIKEKSLKIFEEIAKAESFIHNIKKDKVHFHEIGSIDTIVDIFGTLICLDYFKIKKVYSSILPLGYGSIKCQHGNIPLPAPATLEILKGLPVYFANIKGETITPTGAAILKTITSKFNDCQNIKIQKIGYGAGTNIFKELPNILRICLGEEEEKVMIIETCIDDMNPEIYPYLMEKLFEAGALDIYFIPIFMKKNRPATKIEILSPIEKKDIIIQIVLNETSSIGLRFYEVARKTLDRKKVVIQSPFGKIYAKEVLRPNGKKEVIPEFEECKKIAEKKKIPIKDVYSFINKIS